MTESHRPAVTRRPDLTAALHLPARNTMETTLTAWPPRSSDASGLLAAYTDVLGWPLLADRDPVPQDDIALVLARSSRTVWSTLCEDRFDAVVVPAGRGRATALRLERDEDLRRAGVVVPCLVAGAAWVFFVRAGTAGSSVDVTGAEVLSVGQLLVLPPTDGNRWRTAPWDRDVRRPLDLPDARVLVPSVRAPAGPPADRHEPIPTRPRA
ncbi:hypothetical protein ACWEV4_32660 [Streptomyces sp. NPDC003860]